MACWTPHIGKEYEAIFLTLFMYYHDCYSYSDSLLLARGVRRYQRGFGACEVLKDLTRELPP